MINLLTAFTLALGSVGISPTIVTVPLVATPTVAPVSSANDVVDRVQVFYANIKQVTAQFRQAVTNVTYGSTKTSDGTMWVKKPGNMRWDYLEKKRTGVEVKKSFISNGTNLYVVEHDNKQVIKKNLKQDLMPVAVSFLYGKGDLRAEFNAELDTTGKYGDKDDLVLKLTPKQASAQYKTLVLVVNHDDFHVSQSIIIDSLGNINHFRFFTPDFEKAIKDAYFQFDERTVKNYRVIDADQQPGVGSGAGSADLVPVAPKK